MSPNSLAEAVKVLQACANANVAVIPMGKNTSLTGGATPRNEKSNRPTVVINMSKLKKIQIVGDKQQVLCLAGAGIYDLAQAAKAIERESHSILGSWFLNPTVAAGVAYGSGGTQIRKGPAYTERLYGVRSMKMVKWLYEILWVSRPRMMMNYSKKLKVVLLQQTILIQSLLMSPHPPLAATPSMSAYWTVTFQM